MATDREARALAAGEKIEVDGKEYRLRPVAAQHLMDLEKDALRHYKREYLQTYSQNADLFDAKTAKELLREKMDEVARWDIHDLPQKDVYDATEVPLTPELRAWLSEEYGVVTESNGDGSDEEKTERTLRAVLSTALDSEKLSPQECKRLGGKAPLHGRVRYDQWWVTASTVGLVSFIHSSIRRDHNQMTADDIAGWPYPKLLEAGRIVEKLTSVSLGNG